MRLRLIVVLMACISATWVDCPAASPNADSQPEATTGSGKKKKKRIYPPRKLVNARNRAAHALKGKLDKTFTIVTTGPFVVASDMPAEKVRQYANDLVAASAEAMWASYFRRKPGRVITVLLFAEANSYKKWAMALFKDKNLSPYGYYKPDKRTLVMNISTGGGTLIHELTHALIVYDFPKVPLWFNEGLASLHEQCRPAKDHIVGLVNWRLPALQKAIKNGKLRPLRELVTKRDFYGAQLGVNYAQARYFCMYMQEKKLLKKFYKYFRDHQKGRNADIRAIEKTFGKRINRVEKEYIAWVKTLKYPPSR